MKKTIQRLLEVMFVFMVLSGYMYAIWTSQQQSMEATMVIGAWADMVEENKQLKSDLERQKMWTDSCQQWRVKQSIALGLWRSGYLTTRCEDFEEHHLNFELGIAEQMVTDPWDFEKEFEIINKLKQYDRNMEKKEWTIKACLNERHQFMMELGESEVKADTLHSRLKESVIERKACRKLLEEHSCGHGSGPAAAEHIEGELFKKVQEAIKIKDNIPNR